MKRAIAMQSALSAQHLHGKLVSLCAKDDLVMRLSQWRGGTDLYRSSMSDGAGIALYEEASQRKQGLVRLDLETDAEGHFSR